MKKALISLLKIGLPLAFGLYVIWYVYSLLNPTEKIQLFEAFGRANYFWVVLSIIIGAFSHVSRAYRWKYLLEPMGYQPRFLNSFYAVMIGYIANLALPRLGEVMRCGVMSKYEKISVDKLLGTVIAERVFDMIILIVLTSSVVFLQLDLIGELLNEMLIGFSGGTVLIALGAAGLIGVFGLYLLLKTSSHPFVLKIKKVVLGFADGLKAIFKMKNPWPFIFHTLLIWLLYLAMFWLCLLALPETSNVPTLGVMAAFVLGGISIVLVQGGIGVYPAAVMQTFILYEVARPSGLAIGWIVWTSQTIMLVSLGVFSLIMMPNYNKDKTPIHNTNEARQ